MDLLVYRYWSHTVRSLTEQKKQFSHPPTLEFDLSKFTNAQGKFQYPEVWETKFYLHTRLLRDQTFMWFAVSNFLTSLRYQIPYILNILKPGLTHALPNTYWNKKP